MDDKVPEGKQIPISNIGRGGGTRPGNAQEAPGSPYGERDNDDYHISGHCEVLPSRREVVLRNIKSGNFHCPSDDQTK